MIDLSRHIEYLLLSEEEVCVQQLGVFRAECKPSRWVEDEHLLLPPYRAVCFEPQADVDDTRLLHTLALKYKLTMQEAEIQRTEFVEHLMQELQEDGSADLGNLGVFVSEHRGSDLLFIPSQAGVAAPAYYGLDAIHLEPLPQHEVKPRHQHRKTVSAKSDDDYFVIRIPKRAVHYAASVAAAALLFFAVSTPIAEQAASGTQTAQSALFIPQHLIAPATAEATETTEATETPAASVAPETPEKPESPELPEMSETSATPQAPATPAIAPKASTPSYAVVLASAIPMQRAENYAHELQARGINAEARQCGKIVRVIIPGFATAEAVQEHIQELKSHSAEFEGAWTLKME